VCHLQLDIKHHHDPPAGSARHEDRRAAIGRASRILADILVAAAAVAVLLALGAL